MGAGNGFGIPGVPGYIPGIPDGATPPFVPSQSGGRLSGLAGILNGGAGGWGGFTRSGDVGLPGVNGQEGTDLGANGGSITGVNGLAGTALMMGGTMLAMDGWSRGGGVGMLEMTGGGAAIGFKYGGPLGAAIGAGVGALVGGLHWAFGANPIKEMRDKIKSLTGVSVTDNNILKQFVAASKGSISIQAWIQSREGSNLIEQYAAQTGQKFRNPYNLGQFNMMLSQGGLYEQASYTNGTRNAALSSLPGMGFGDLSSLVSGSPSSGSQPVTISLDGPATTAVLQGQAATVITNSPRLVAASNSKAMNQNYSRFDVATANQPTAIAG
jgi:hypothetical protein